MSSARRSRRFRDLLLLPMRKEVACRPELRIRPEPLKGMRAGGARGVQEGVAACLHRSDVAGVAAAAQCLGELATIKERLGHWSVQAGDSLGGGELFVD